MDSSKKKIEHRIRHSPEPEKKRESRLTSIIDQLISNKAKGLNNNSIKEENQKNNINDSLATDPDSGLEENNNGAAENRPISSANIKPTSTKAETATPRTGSSSERSAKKGLKSATDLCNSIAVNGNAQVQSEGEQQKPHQHQPSSVKASPGVSGLSSFASTPLNRSRKKWHHRSSRKTAKDGELQPHLNSGCNRNNNNKNNNNTIRERSPPSAPPTALPQPAVQPLPSHPLLAAAVQTVPHPPHPPHHQHLQQSQIRLQSNSSSSLCTLLQPPIYDVVVPSATTSSSSSNCTTIASAVAAATRAHRDFVHFAAVSAMPADTLVVDPAKIKSERLSPPALDSLSSPSGSPSPTAARSPASSTTSSSRLAGIVAASHPRYPTAAFPSTPPPPSPAPTPSTPGLDRFSPASLGSCTGTPILKQMEQMMTRNYSDFMRSLAAKYNNSNPAESYNYAQVNGFMRNFDGRFPFKTATPPLTGLTNKDDGNRKNENHSAPPVLGDQRGNMGTPLRVVDLSSTQALINMMRSASAHSASQLENYLRGTLKRPLGLDAETRADPLDLTVNSTKKSRTDAFAFDPSALSLRLHGGKSIRDLHDLFGSFKSDSEGSDASSDASPKSTNSRLWSAASLVDTKPQLHSPTDPSPGVNRSPGSNSDGGQQHPCLSTCADRACTDASQASVVAKWTVDDVCQFVAAIDICAEYVETFREQSIDGAALPLLTEEHLINNMNMKLGPALKFRATLAKTIGHCAVCMHCIHCHGMGNSSAVGGSGATDRRTESN